MSIRRMTLGAGYRYLMSSVARTDEATRAAGLTAYYAATGTPPGWFLADGSWVVAGDRDLAVLAAAGPRHTHGRCSWYRCRGRGGLLVVLIAETLVLYAHVMGRNDGRFGDAIVGAVSTAPDPG